MKKSAFYSDLLFTFFAVGIFTLCLFRYFRISLPVCILLSIVCGALAACAVGAFLAARRKTYFLKKSDEAQKEKLLLHLVLLSDEQKTNYFYNVLRKTHAETRRFSRLRVATDERFYFLLFQFSPVSADQVAACSRLKTSKQKTLLCRTVDPEAERLCKNLGIEIFTGAEVYAMLKNADSLPKAYLGETAPQEKRKRRFRLCCAKSNARRFLLSGVLILLASLFTPFPYYYLIFGCLLLVAALFIRVFGLA